MPQKFVMSRDGRKLLAKLRAGREGTDESPLNIMVIDAYMINHYVTPVLACVKSNDKPFIYQMKTIDNKLGNNHMRDDINLIGVMSPDDLNVYVMQYWRIVSGFLIADYSHSELVELMQIVCTYPYKDINDACGIAYDRRIYSLAYIKAILERRMAEKEYNDERNRKLMQRVNDSAASVQTKHTAPKINRSVVDLDIQFQTALEEAEIRKAFDELSKGK